ncbi:MAG: hypothetical protein J6W19_11310 [Prevotella sp.]|nr:hypothetical protein [Prevotella sp.]
MKYRAAKPRRGKIGVASHFYGWYVEAAGKACRRYAMCITYLSRTYGTPVTVTILPAIRMAGYPYQMPTASLC